MRAKKRTLYVLVMIVTIFITLSSLLYKIYLYTQYSCGTMTALKGYIHPTDCRARSRSHGYNRGKGEWSLAGMSFPSSYISIYLTLPPEGSLIYPRLFCFPSIFIYIHNFTGQSTMAFQRKSFGEYICQLFLERNPFNSY